MTQVRGEQVVAHDGAAVGDLFDALARLTFSWAARPVARLYLDRAGVPIEPTHHVVLRYIGVSGPLRLSDLAALANMTPSNASKVVADLVDAGLVSRRIPRDDRRVTLLELTGEGGGALGRLQETGSAMLAERLSSFSPEEVDDLRGLLGRLADEVEAWTSTLSREPGDGPGDGPGGSVGPAPARAGRSITRTGGGSSAATQEES